MHNVMILGAPGSGKGTQGKILAGSLGIPQVSTGDLIRAAMKNGTPLGVQARAYYDQGALVPDELIFGLIQEILDSKAAVKGVLMDGFPRTVPQADAVDRMLRAKGAKVDRVLLLEVDEKELIQRLLGRAEKEGRADDNAESITKRLEVFKEQTAPLINYYENRGIVKRVPGTGSVEDISARMLTAIR